MPVVFDALDDEWERHLAADPAVAGRLPDACRLADQAGTLAEVEAYVRRAEPAAADAVLHSLVDRARGGDSLAARVVLQILLPSARRMARTGWALGDHEERARAAVAAVYDRIRRYPPGRRPRQVAANIVMDAVRDVLNNIPPRHALEFDVR